MRLQHKFLLFKRINGRRIGAYIIDILAIKFISYFLFNQYLLIFLKTKSPLSYLSFNGLDEVLSILFTVNYLAYFTFCFSIYNGRTLGLFLLGIQVKRSHFQSTLTFKECLNRSMANYVCHKIYFILFLLPLFRADNKGLPDILSNSQTCYAVHEESVSPHQILLNSEEDSSRELDQAA